MKRIFLISLLFLLVLAACERPAREVPDTVTDEETPVNSLEEAKPDEGGAATDGEVDPATEGETTTEGETGAETPAEGEGTTAGGTDETAPAETDTTTQPAAAAEEPQNVTYSVQAGDTLFAIGLLYGVSVDDIVAANNLANADSLEVGQLIIIPVGGLPDTATEPAGGETGAATATGEQIHIVSAGQTLFSIGQTYGFTVDELANYNNLANPNRLEIGQEIKIPPRP